VFIETDETFSVGEQMKLVFWPPNRKEPIKTEGQVAWSPPKGVGVKFPTQPGKDLEKMIEAL
jgi:Tfp pilus assembly protein PilZ